MEKQGLNEYIGKEIAYKGRGFDLHEVGRVEKVVIKIEKGLKVPMLEIVFPNSFQSLRESTPEDFLTWKIEQNIMECVDEKNRAEYEWRKKERELINKPIEEAVKKIEQFPKEKILELLRERIKENSRFHKDTAVILLGEIALSGALSSKELKDLVIFLLEQSKLKREKRRQESLGSLRISKRSSEDIGVRASCLITVAQIAKKRQKEMTSVVQEVAEELKKDSSARIKKTARYVLDYLKNQKGGEKNELLD